MMEGKEMKGEEVGMIGEEGGMKGEEEGMKEEEVETIIETEATPGRLPHQGMHLSQGGVMREDTDQGRERREEEETQTHAPVEEE